MSKSRVSRRTPSGAGEYQQPSNDAVSQSSSIALLLLESDGIRTDPRSDNFSSGRCYTTSSLGSNASTQTPVSIWDPFQSHMLHHDPMAGFAARSCVQLLHRHNAGVNVPSLVVDETQNDTHIMSVPPPLPPPAAAAESQYCDVNARNTPFHLPVERHSLHVGPPTVASIKSYSTLSHTSNDSTQPLLSYLIATRSTGSSEIADCRDGGKKLQSWKAFPIYRPANAASSATSMPLTASTDTLPSSTLLPVIRTSMLNVSSECSSENAIQNSEKGMVLQQKNARTLSISTEELMRMVYNSDSSTGDFANIPRESVKWGEPKISGPLFNKLPRKEQSQVLPSKRTRGFLRDRNTPPHFQEDAVSYILESYLALDPYQMHYETETRTQPLLHKDSVRDLEKEAARHVFKDSADWQDNEKISQFLRGTKDLQPR